MKHKETDSKNQHIIMEAHHQQAQYIAPIPPPAMLADYNKIDKTFAERIMKMAEEQNAADIQMNKEIVRHSFSLKRLGQVFSFIIVLIGFSLAAVFGFIKDSTVVAVTSLIVAVVPIATATVRGMLKE